MFNEIDRDGDIYAWALDRWSGEVGTTRSLKLRAEEQPVRVVPLQGWAPDVLYDLWRFSCEMPDAPHLRQKRVPLSAPDFTSTSIRVRWKAGHDDTARALERRPWENEFDPMAGVAVHNCEPALLGRV